jgi:hypothetical protein
MSFNARCFVCHVLSYFTWYPNATMTTSINVVIVINGQLLMMLTSLCEINLEDSWMWFLSSTFVKQVLGWTILVILQLPSFSFLA